MSYKDNREASVKVLVIVTISNNIIRLLII